MNFARMPFYRAASAIDLAQGTFLVLSANMVLLPRTGQGPENGKKMTDFAKLDSILLPWAETHELHVYRRDRSPPLRSVIVYYWLGTHHESAGHMWLEFEKDDRISVHGAAPDWHEQKTVSLSELESVLENMFQTMIARPVWD